MSTHDEDQLRATLRAHADRGRTRPVDLDAVTTTARRIRRRRTTLAALSAAAVVAVVPAGLAVTGTLDRDGTPPVAGQDDSSAIEPPEELLEVPLLQAAQPDGVKPSLAYIRGSDIVSPVGEDVAVPGDGAPVSLAVLGDTWLVGMHVGEGRYTLDTVDASGRLLGSVPMRQGGPVLSDDGTVAAYVSEDNAVHSITAQDGDQVLVPSASFSSPVSVVGIVGSQSCADEGNDLGGCKVAVNRGDDSARLATASGIVEDVPGFQSLDDLSATWVLGRVSASDFGSCSAMDENGERRWRTCKNSLDRVSPDERYVIGFPAYYDGLGSRSVSIVDMADGRERVRFEDTGTSDTFVRHAVWESDTSLLMAVWDGEDRSWSILRGGLDGSLSEVETGIPGTSTDPTLHLAAR